ncbi:MAG: hypothetical protein M1820_002477 [Bogoriella megaspora]|nr:MAG: hypothetical protein M1820_002477 [Bogoriella megaspora]
MKSAIGLAILFAVAVVSMPLPSPLKEKRDVDDEIESNGFIPATINGGWNIGRLEGENSPTTTGDGDN